MFDKSVCEKVLLELDQPAGEAGPIERNKRAAAALRQCLDHIEQLEKLVSNLQAKIGTAADDTLKARDA